ncbi:MAG: gliding motility lipoprotein GldH [Bacteroidota bacterium]
MRAFFFLILIMLALQACDESRIYERNIDLPDKIWLSDSTLNFKFEVDSNVQAVNLYYNVRNSLSYPFQNLYIKYTLQDTLGTIFNQELVNQNLFDIKTGKPFGSGIGDVFDHQFELLRDFKFEKHGKYQVSIQHYMRPDTLREIISVGIRLEHSTLE